MALEKSRFNPYTESMLNSFTFQVSFGLLLSLIALRALVALRLLRASAH